MTTIGLQRRVAHLEEASLPAESLPKWARIIVHEGEAEEEVMARHLADHPREPAPTHWIVQRIVSPCHPIQSREAAQNGEVSP